MTSGQASQGKVSPLVVVITGSSGVGKDTIIRHLKELQRPWHFVVTATTRKPRDYERDGVDYIFLTRQAFRKKLEQGEFLEHAQVYGEWYGVPRSQVSCALAKGMDVFIKVDIQGAATIRRLVPDAVFIFVAPPSLDELRRRLEGRRTEAFESLERRLNTVAEEMERAKLCDYIVVNRDGQAQQAAACIDAIVTAEKCRVQPRKATI